jgi:hypothetical protein
MFMADGGWFDCEVIRAGPAQDGTIYIALRDVGDAFPSRWFTAVAPMEREMLATALTAISTGIRVRASLASTDENATINRLYVAQDV